MIVRCARCVSWGGPFHSDERTAPSARATLLPDGRMDLGRTFCQVNPISNAKCGLTNNAIFLKLEDNVTASFLNKPIYKLLKTVDKWSSYKQLCSCSLFNVKKLCNVRFGVLSRHRGPPSDAPPCRYVWSWKPLARRIYHTTSILTICWLPHIGQRRKLNSGAAASSWLQSDMSAHGLVIAIN